MPVIIQPRAALRSLENVIARATARGNLPRITIADCQWGGHLARYP
jgi:hypothetical protein